MINVGEVLETAVNSMKAGKIYLIEKRLYEDRIIDHLKLLSSEDRYMRFGTSINDQRIEHYVKETIKVGDHVFAIFGDEGEIAGLLHMARDMHDKQGYEIGISIDARYREQGYAGELFKKAITFAKTLGAKHIYTYCLSENKAMQKLAKKNGLNVMLEYGDVTGKLDLNDQAGFDHLRNLVEFATTEQMMIFDASMQNAVQTYLKNFSTLQNLYKSFTPLFRVG